MDFMEIVKARQSDRAFDPERVVEKEKLERILEAGRLAPSACNSQPWHFIVVDEPELKNRVAECTASRVLNMNHFTMQAPVHVLIVEERANITSAIGGLVKRKEFPQIDIGIAAAHMCLAARAEGLGSCMIGWFDEKKIRSLLSIPSSRRVRLDIVLGYSIDPLREKRRKEAAEVISYNRYGLRRK
jgi:nitroreductase